MSNLDYDIRSNSFRRAFNPFSGISRNQLTSWDASFVDPVGGEDDLTLMDFYKTQTSFSLFDEVSQNEWSYRAPKYEPDAVGVACCTTGEPSGTVYQITGEMTCAKYDFWVCYEEVVKHFASGQVAAGAEQFERYVREMIPADAGDVARKSEVLFYQGQYTSSSDLHLGILKYFDDGGGSIENISTSTSGVTDLLDAFLYMYDRMPEDASGTKLGEIIILVPVQIGRALRPRAIDRWPGLGATLIDRTQDDFSPINLPNVPATIYPVYGLKGTNNVIVTPRRNIIWLNSRSTSYTTVQSWYSDDDDRLWWRIKLLQGTVIRLINWIKIFDVDAGLITSAVGVHTREVA